MKRGYVLGSQSLRRRIVEGFITTSATDLSFFSNGDHAGQFRDRSLEARIQPASMDLVCGDEAFVLDGVVFGPEAEKTVYARLLELPRRRRQKVSLAGGFEMKRGFTYLLPLEERITFKKNEWIKSSPKSTMGRLFPKNRLFVDYNPCIDEANSVYRPDTPLQSWLLVQPGPINLIAHPGTAFNQVRFFHGVDARLTTAEILALSAEQPLLYTRDADGTLTPVQLFFQDGLQIHLDGQGKHTSGIVGLRVRQNPMPIDLHPDKVGTYAAEDFFEPLVQRDHRPLHLEHGEHYLLASKEVMRIPPGFNVELQRYSRVGFSGAVDQAGFIDPGFQADLVFEYTPDEPTGVELRDGMPMSRVDVFRNELPDKVYGEQSGSHYQGQVGPKTAKYFAPLDHAFAAGNIQKLSRDVLVQDARILLQQRTMKEGFEFIDGTKISSLEAAVAQGFFQSRYDCETDPLVLQPIPYILIFGNDETVFTYVRAENIRDYGDARLFGKHSLGVGGHIGRNDAPDYLQRCLERELNEEVAITGNTTSPYLAGTLMCYDKPVDRVHFGLIYVFSTDGSITPCETALHSGRLEPLANVMHDEHSAQKYETWSKALLPHLPAFYKIATHNKQVI
ncbi:2'-deoxycytidine 5'-triphosphate deaminase [Candidatus Woesearchaeota archaeon]|nr:2'-deoxycytidine 5'-triphosphate deaminase [Candidatus Woesearchaeota archaeon]